MDATIFVRRTACPSAWSSLTQHAARNHCLRSRVRPRARYRRDIRVALGFRGAAGRGRRVVREGTRETKVYRLTPAGEAAVRAWLAASPGPPVLKHPVALRVFFGHLLDADELRQAIEAHRDWCDRMGSATCSTRARLARPSTTAQPSWRELPRRLAFYHKLQRSRPFVVA